MRAKIEIDFTDEGDEHEVLQGFTLEIETKEGVTKEGNMEAVRTLGAAAAEFIRKR